MANLSDAWGEIKVFRVGKEFLEFLNKVQGPDSSAYYTLVDPEDLDGVEADEDNNLTMSFSTFGRWSYENNIEGYLDGKWMSNDQEAYAEFIEAVKKNDGVIVIEYKDSEGGSQFMGEGVAVLKVLKGEVCLDTSFSDEEYTIGNFAKLQDESQEWALGYLYGEDTLDLYGKYIDTCEKANSKPVDPETWFETIYEGE